MISTNIELEAKVRQEPRLSINKLGEYLTSSATRQNSILRTSKYPKGSIVARYNDFYSMLSPFVESGLDSEVLRQLVDEIQSAEARSKWHKQNKSLNIELIQALEKSIYSIDLEDCYIKDLSSSSGHLMINGVDVSVRPDLLLWKEVKGERVYGGIKFHLPKTHHLDETSGQYIASVLKRYLLSLKGVHTVKDEMCYVIDVPQNTVYNSPKSYKKRWLDIEAQCFQIAAIWKQI